MTRVPYVGAVSRRKEAAYPQRGLAPHRVASGAVNLTLFGCHRLCARLWGCSRTCLETNVKRRLGQKILKKGRSRLRIAAALRDIEVPDRSELRRRSMRKFLRSGRGADGEFDDPCLG